MRAKRKPALFLTIDSVADEGRGTDEALIDTRCELCDRHHIERKKTR